MPLSTAEVSPEYSPSPKQNGTPPGSAPSDERPTRLLRASLIAVVAALIVGVLLLAAFHRETPSTQKMAQSPTANFQSRPILRLKGSTEAVRMRAILAPVLSGEFVATLTITKLTPAGTKVKQGDLLAEFDRQAQIRDSIDKQAEYDKLVSQVAEEQAKEDAARAKDETEIKQAEDNLSKAQLEMQKTEIMSRIDAEKAQEDLLVAEQRKYELGAQTIFFVLDAQTRLAEAESNLLQAQVSYQIAVAAVDHATGGLLQPYHVQVAELSR